MTKPDSDAVVRRITPKLRGEHRRLAVEATTFHAALMQAGLIKSGQKMHEVVRQVGWEIAEQEEKDAKRK